MTRLAVLRWVPLPILTITLSLLSVSPVMAQSAQDQTIQMLVMLYATRDTDDKCGGLSVDEREQLERLIEVGLSNVQLTAEQSTLLQSGLSEEDIDCETSGFIEMFRTVVQADENDPANDAEVTEEDLKKSLETVMASLSAGQLEQISGCWTSELLSWTLQLCFTHDGDGSEIVLTQAKSGTTCRFDAGQARRREGGAFFYAYPSSPQCSDGRRIGHVEGWCSELAQAEMNCLVSVFEHTNIFLTDNPDSTEGLNGELSFARE